MVWEGFLLLDPNHWKEEETFSALASQAAKLHIVNDAVEWGIALMEQYNQPHRRRKGEAVWPPAGVRELVPIDWSPIEGCIFDQEVNGNPFLLVFLVFLKPGKVSISFVSIFIPKQG